MMWTPLPSPSPLPKVASAPVSPAKATAGFSQATNLATNQATHLAVSQVANASAGPQASQRSAETQGGFARALQQAAAHDSAAHNKPPEPSRTEGAPADGAAQGTPNRFDSAAKAAQSRAAAARLERSQAAAATAPASQRQGSPSAPDEPASGAAPATSPSTDETPCHDATCPEAGAVGALLSQLRAAAAATTDPTQPADRAAASLAAAQTASARAGRSTSATLTPTADADADGPGARRAAALVLGEPTSLTAGPGQAGAGSSAAASAASSGAQQAYSAEHADHADHTNLAANAQPTPDAQPWLTPALAGAQLGLHGAPPAGSPTDLTRTMGEAHLSAPLGSPAFGPQLGAQITTFVRDGLEHARLQLNPANMGPVLVQIQVDGQTAQVHLSAEHAWTRQALEDAMPQLASQLREAGLTLSGGGVSEQAQQGRQAPSPPPTGQTPSADPTEALVQQPRPAAARRGVVDLVA